MRDFKLLSRFVYIIRRNWIFECNIIDMSHSVSKDITGNKYGKLTVTKFSHKENDLYYWECLCGCGNLKLINRRHLQKNGVKSCGCLHGRQLLEDLTGKTFNRLLLKERLIIKNKHNIRKTFYECLCSCGNFTVVKATEIKSGKIKSCGCLKKEICRSRANDWTGKKVGKWTVISKDQVRTKIKHIFWICECECGTLKSISGTTLGVNYRKNINCSCGCHVSGEFSPLWNSKLTAADRISRREIRAYRVWRRKVFKRDKYICQLSGRNGNVNAHHLDGWSLNTDNRDFLNNGILIATEIHILFHRIYGQKDNTRKQFSEFMTRYKSQEFDCLFDDNKLKRSFMFYETNLNI